MTMRKIFIFTVLFLMLPVSVFSAVIDYSYQRVVSVEEIYDKVYSNNSSYRIICNQDDTVAETLTGAVLGGIGANILSSRSRHRGFKTILGAGTGALIGHSIASKKNCEKVYYPKTIKNVFIGYLILLDNGDTFTTTERYRIGDIVKVKTTYE